MNPWPTCGRRINYRAVQEWIVKRVGVIGRALAFVTASAAGGLLFASGAVGLTRLAPVAVRPTTSRNTAFWPIAALATTSSSFRGSFGSGSAA